MELISLAEAEKQEAALPVLDFAALAALDIPARVKLVPWLPEGGLVMVHAPRGLGKTWFVLGLAAALVGEGYFLKWHVERRVGVLLIDGEMDLAELRQRVLALAPASDMAPLCVLSHQNVFERERRDMNFGYGEWQDRIKEHLDAHPDIRVVVFDNLSCLLPTTAEDKRDEWARDVLPFLIWMRRRRIAAVLVHHSGKAGQQRGTSAHDDQMDTIIRLDPVPGDDGSTGARFMVAFTKSRGAFGDDVAPIEAVLGADADGSLAWSWRAAPEASAERLLGLLRDSDAGLTLREAAEALDLSPAMVHKLKKTLVTQGKLKPGRSLELAGETETDADQSEMFTDAQG